MDALILGVVGGLLAMAAYSLVEHLRPRSVRADPRTGERVLRFGAEYRLPSILMGVIAAALPVFLLTSVQFGGPIDAIAGGLATVGLLALAVWGIGDATTFEARFGEEGLKVASVWRSRRTIPWSTIRAVQYSPWAQWFVLELQNGQSVRISKYVRGIGDLFDALRTHLTGDALRSVGFASAALK